MHTVKNLVMGSAGMGSVELVQSVDIPTSGETSEIIKILIQLVIGVATLIGLFKKKTPNP